MIFYVNEKADLFLINEMEKLGKEETSENKAKCLDALARMYDARVKYEEVASQEDVDLKKSTTDVVVSENEAETKKWDRIAEMIVGLVVPAGWIAFDAWISMKGFKFEETGSITSHVFKSLWQSFNRHK